MEAKGKACTKTAKPDRVGGVGRVVMIAWTSHDGAVSPDERPAPPQPSIGSAKIVSSRG